MSGIGMNPSALLSGDPASWPAGKPSKLVSSLRPAPLGRMERIRRFGVDCGDGLTWAPGWQPGGEYTKQLVVKNVSKGAVRIKYKLPESKFFSMAFPETIQLTPGLSKVLEIHFRPLRLEEYDDCIEFATEKGTFVVPIRAAIPQVHSHVPTNLDFGFCPVQEMEQKSFNVSNDGEVPITFSWQCEKPFKLEPMSGTIAPGEAAPILASFRPTDASVFVAHCVCTVPGHTNHVIKLGGIGKYTFLSATTEKLDFERVLTGQTKTMEFKLRNSSLVYARFKIVRTDSDVESVFTFAPTSGLIPPDGELSVAVLYAPKVTGTFTSDHYEVRTSGGNVVPIEVVGEAVGPRISLSKEVINFGDVPIELPAKKASRVLEIVNESETPVPYLLFGAETNGLFRLSNPSGILSPRQPSYVTFEFSPLEPGNYYKRIYLLFLNAKPMAIDIIGSGYNDKRRPLPIQPRFVTEYIARESRGLHRLAPEELQQRADARIAAFEKGEPMDDEEDAPFSMQTSELTASLDPVSEQALMRGLFRGAAWRNGAVHLEEDYVDFGAGSRLRPSEQKTVRLTNRTNGKLSVLWVVPPNYVNGGPRDQTAPVFAITPQACDVQPNSTVTFKLQFRPQSDQQYYVQTLECFCAFKAMRTFRLVSETNFALPWCLPLTATGDSFPMGAEQFIPRGILSHRLLTFPAVHVGDAAFQTISIKNDNDTPMLFNFSNDLGTAFKILPPVGLVPPGCTQLLAVRFSPLDASRYHRTATITLNNDLGAALQMMLIGTGCQASLTMPSKVFCPTACVGASSVARMTVTNPSRLPLAYEWDVPEKLMSQLSVDQPAGVLRGRESVELTWSFAPTYERNYLVKVPCLVSAIDETGEGGASHDLVKQVVTISGIGSTGKIKAEPELLEYGTVLVNDTHRRILTLINSSAVDLYYALTFSLASRSGDDNGPAVDDLITCEAMEGLVPARNTVDIVDTRLHGVPQELLWQQLRVPEINSELRGVLSEAENSLLSSEGLSSMGDVASMAEKLPMMDMMMPPGLPGDPVTLLHLLVRNEGLLTASFQLRYPTEMELQIEHWADKGEPSATELKQHLIVDKGIMSISPKAAELAPGEEVELLIRMRHFRADDYELPILLQVGSGRQIVLNLLGHTLARGEKHLHIPLREIPLPPTPIGLPSAQRHTFELPNYGDVPLPYEVQLSQLHKINAANYGFPVLVCEDPAGVIPPGGVAHVRFRFHPLEVKDYHVALPVAIGDIGVSTFVLLASGYHPNEPTEYGAYLAQQAALLPPAQQLVPRAQPMRLSFDRALFGQVPSGATVRKLVVLRNISDCACDFAWDTAHPLWGTILSIYPSHGTLQVGQHLCCKLSLIGVGPPEELRTSLACALLPHVDPNAMTSSEAALAAAEKNAGGLGLLPASHPLAAGTALRPRSPPRLSVTEHKPKLRGLHALLHIEERESRRQAAAAGLTRAEYAQTSEHTGRPAQTLAPNVIAAQQAQAGYSGSAMMPKLLLDVRACISPAEVLVAGKADLSTFMLPRATQPIEAPPVPSTATITSSPATRQPLPPLVAEQRGAVESIAMQMIADVLKDPAVTRAVATAEEERTPWFAQIAAPPPVEATPPTVPAPPPVDLGSTSAASVALASTSEVSVAGYAPAAAEAVAAAAALPLDDQSLEAHMEAADRMARAQRRAAEVERKRREVEDGEKIRSASEFQELVAYVLEGTLFNLVSEVSMGEFALDTVPRQIVRSLEITQELPAPVS